MSTTEEKLDRILALLEQLLGQRPDIEPDVPDMTTGIPVKLRAYAIDLINGWRLAAGPATRRVIDALPSRILFPRKGLTEGEQSLLTAAYNRARGQTKAEQIAYTDALIRGTLPGYYIAIGPSGDEIPWLGLHPDPNPGARLPGQPVEYDDAVIINRAERQVRRDVYNAILEDNPGRQIVDGLPKD